MDSPDLLVLGAGVIGLTSAIDALERGLRTSVWTLSPPSESTSAVAAALWYPFLAEPRERVLEWSRTTFEVLARQAQEVPEAGVRMTPFVEVFAEEEPDVWWLDIVPTARFLPKRNVPAGYHAAMELELPVADTRVYLPWLLARVAALGGEVVTRRVESLAEVHGVAARATVNCTGLGAAALCSDTSLVPIRGQVLVADGLALEAGLLDDTGEHPIYAIPRGEEIVLGGTAQRGNFQLDVDDDDSARILGGLVPHVPGVASANIRVVKVGLRPWRHEIRVETERCADGTRIVHNYGHGGSGYTVAWGCAKGAIDLALGSGS